MATQFFRAADLAGGHEYWNAAGLLYVHAAIAFADAVTIRWGGLKSTSDNHMDSVELLGEVMPNAKGRAEALGHLRDLIREKTRVAYTGQSFRRKDVAGVAKDTHRFRAWCETHLRA